MDFPLPFLNELCIHLCSLQSSFLKSKQANHLCKSVLSVILIFIVGFSLKISKTSKDQKIEKFLRLHQLKDISTDTKNSRNTNFSNYFYRCTRYDNQERTELRINKLNKNKFNNSIRLEKNKQNLSLLFELIGKLKNFHENCNSKSTLRENN